MSELICIYQNAKGEAKVQHLIEVQNKNSNTDQYHYLMGWSVSSDTVKTLRSDRVHQEFKTIEEAELALSTMDILPLNNVDNYNPNYHISALDNFDICFTGFKKSESDELKKLAHENDMNICKSVTLHLNMLCCGYNAGPVKVRKAMNKGIFIVSRQQFEHFVETGEIPDGNE